MSSTTKRNIEHVYITSTTIKQYNYQNFIFNGDPPSSLTGVVSIVFTEDVRLILDDEINLD